MAPPFTVRLLPRGEVPPAKRTHMPVSAHGSAVSGRRGGRYANSRAGCPQHAILSLVKPWRAPALWGVTAAVVGFLIGLVGASLAGAESPAADCVWGSLVLVVVAGVVLAVGVQGRRLAGVSLSVGAIIGFFGFWWVLLTELNNSGALGN